MLLVYLTIPNPDNCSHGNESTLRQAMTNQLNMHVSGSPCFPPHSPQPTENNAFYRRRERTGKGRVRE